MIKLKQLTDYLRDPEVLRKAGIRCLPERVYYESDSGVATLRVKKTATGLELFRHEYEGSIFLESVAGDIRVLLGMIIGWLQERDRDREELDPVIRWSGTPFDDGTGDLEIHITFRETPSFSPGDQTANFLYQERPYRLDGDRVDVAERLAALRVREG